MIIISKVPGKRLKSMRGRGTEEICRNQEFSGLQSILYTTKIRKKNVIRDVPGMIGNRKTYLG